MKIKIKDNYINEFIKNINNIINNFKIDISKLNNDIEILNSINIKYKNKIEKLSKISYIKLDENNNIIITPIEKELVKIIEEFIKKQNIELSIINMGLYLIILKQQVDKEKKIKIIKLIKKLLEENKIKIRNLRRKILINEKNKINNENNIKIIENIVNENIIILNKIYLEKLKIYNN